jgi:hypothetical protein
MMQRLNRMSEPSINSVSALLLWRRALKVIPGAVFTFFSNVCSVARRLPEVMAITLLWRSRSTDQLHGVRAEIVGTILNGIEKREAATARPCTRT